MKINNLSVPAFGTQQNYNNKTHTNNTITVSRNALIAGLVGLLTSCNSDTFTLTAPQDIVETLTITPNNVHPKNISDLYYKVSSKTKIDSNTYSQIVNGQKYIVHFSDEGYSVTQPNGEIKTFNYEQRCATMDEDQLDEMVDYLEDQNALVLADLATEAAELRYFWGLTARGYYDCRYERINANKNNLLHELGHALDFYNNTGSSFERCCWKSDYDKTAESEYKALTAEINKTQNPNLGFRNVNIDSNSEIFAECAALIMSSGKFDRNKDTLETFFPKTLALTRKYIDEIHKRSQNSRRYFSAKLTKIEDGKVESLIISPNGQKIKKSVFDPKKWPTGVDPYQAKFNAQGQITEEVISSGIKYTISTGKYTHKKLNPNTGKVISETTKKGLLDAKCL